MPRLEELWNRLKDNGLSVVAVEVAQQGKEALKVIEEKKLTFHCLETHVGPNDPVKQVFDVQALPMSLIVDAEGRVLFAHYGFSEGDEAGLEEEVRAILGS